MKPSRPVLLSAFFALFSGIFVAAPRTAQAGVSFNFFYGSLAPRGAWVSVSDYGYCWRPAGVSVDWRPYTDGYWAYTDAGWTWVSYEDWGGITYHYGRWTLVDGYGWVWVPGYNWGPAWVSWRRSDDYVGWAPLPPECRFHPGISIGFSVDSSYGIGPGWYSFCAVHDFGSPSLGPVILDPSRNVTIINRTVNITNISYDNGVVRNGGPSLAFVSQRSARPIQRLTLVRNASPGAMKNGFQSVRAGRLQLVAPAIIRSPGAKPAAVARVFSKAGINHGWSGIPSATRTSLRAQFSHEKGIKSLAALPKTKAPAIAPLVAVKPAPGTTFKKSAQPKPLLEPFRPAVAQSPQKVEAAKKFEATRKAEPVKSSVAPKTVAIKTYQETYHAPKPPSPPKPPSNPKPPKPQVVDRTLKLRAPPAPPKVSTAGGSQNGKGNEKKGDKKRNDQDQ